MHFVACSSAGPCAMVKSTAPSSYLRRIFYWSSCRTICCPLTERGEVSYPGSCRQRRDALDKSFPRFSVHSVIRENELHPIQVSDGSLSTSKALFVSEPNAGFRQCGKTSSTLSVQQQVNGLRREWTQSTLAPPLRDVESRLLNLAALSPTARFWLRSVYTQAINFGKDVSGASKVSFNERGRHGYSHVHFQKRHKRRAFSSDPGSEEETLAVTKRNFTTASFTVPKEGNRGLTLRDVISTLQTQTDAKSAMTFFEWAEKQTGFEHSAATYCALVQVLGFAKETDALRQVSADINRTRWKTRWVLQQALARAYCQCGLLEEAIECVRKLHNTGYPLTPFHFNKLLEVLVNVGCYEKAYVMYEQMLTFGRNPDPCTFNILINGFGKAGRLEMMEKLIDEMKDKSCEPTVVTFGTLVNILCKAGREDDAYTFFIANKGLANVFVYNTMLHGLGKIGRIEQALQLFREMKMKAFIPRVDTVNIVIQSLGHVNRVEEAWSIFKDMTSMGLAPDLFTYNLMMKILIKAKRVTESLRLLEEMTSSSCKPDTVTYGTLIYELGQNGDVDNARKLFEQMRGAGVKPNVIIYGLLIGALCSGGKLDEAIMVVNEMMAAGCIPDEFVCFTVCGNLLKAGRVDDAQELFSRMGNMDKQTYLIAYNTAIDGLGKSGKVERLWSLFQEMQQTGLQPDVITYNTLIVALGKRGHVDKACKLFLDMQVSGCSPDVVSYTTLIDLLFRNGRTWDACDLFEDMKEKGVVPNAITFGSLVTGLCRVGEFEKAYSIYKEMRSQGCVLNEYAYLVLIQGFSCSPKHVDEAYALFKDMTEKGYRSDHFTFQLLMRSLKKAGKMNEAQFVRSRIPQKQSGKQLGGLIHVDGVTEDQYLKSVGDFAKVTSAPFTSHEQYKGEP